VSRRTSRHKSLECGQIVGGDSSEENVRFSIACRMLIEVLAYRLMVVFERAGRDGFVVSSSARYEMIQAVSSDGRLFKDMSKHEMAS
jgi:hypothetical protein